MTTVLQALNEAMHEAMAGDERVLFLGEDILDPYGGAFKVAKGLSTRFPDRVRTTPISEAAITGIAAGLALRGFRPIVEIMFGDFLSLTFDQFLNHCSKYRWMYNDQVDVPMVVRTPMGGRRGYGPTHSQCTEKYFLGMPRLRVLAPNAISDPKQLLLDAVLSGNEPTLFVEHKLLYSCRCVASADRPGFEITRLNLRDPHPTVSVRIAGAPKAQVTIAAYGYMAELALDAVWRLAMEQEIFAEVVVPTSLSPMDSESILQSFQKTGRLLTVEEAPVALGWGSEVLSRSAEADPGGRFVAARVGALNLPIAGSRPLENAILPSVQDIFDAAVRIAAK
jgi:pyruvate/2-oxoglutarate/acetoin dehydrogenase E1 component